MLHYKRNRQLRNKMKYIILTISLLILSACSPKYKIVKEYHAPKISNSTQTPICLGVCETNRNACKQTCDANFSSCQVKAHRIAQERYNAQMQRYTAQLERYVNEMQLDHFNAYFYHFDYYGYPYYRSRYGNGYGGYGHSLFWYDPMPFYSYAPKPKKPSLKIEQLKAEEEFCDKECACTQKFDNCYIGCGGEIVSKKVCIENCP